jgi:NO-binding membrane sensor protein with MHYT domain
MPNEIHHFAYGWFNPAVAFALAFAGSLTGLVCTARAREAGSTSRRSRWLVLGSLTIGGAGIWLMHFMAMLGFDVPATSVRYDPFKTFVSVVVAIAAVACGLFIVGTGKRSTFKLLIAGILTGAGVVAMHYTGMYALEIGGTIGYRTNLVIASVIIAVVAATVALWFTVWVQGWKALLTASTIMAIAVCGMHYTGMAALRVHVVPGPLPSKGIAPGALLVPIFLVAAVALLIMFVSALQAMTREEFDEAPPLPPAAIPGQLTPPRANAQRLDPRVTAQRTGLRRY